MIGALSIEAFLATDRVFDDRINALRPHPGQTRVADNLRALLRGSEIMTAHRDCGRVQDPYSFRCIPVVHGAVRDAADHVERVLQIEADSVTDNPLIFAADDEFLTGGNFHGQPVGLVCDFLKAAMVQLASMSERRLYLLLNGEERGLPLFLARRPGLESGLMLVQYTAAALVSENKSLAFPISVDSIPTSAGQEDHVSMATTAARTLDRILDNVEGALACELLGALAATDMRRPLRSGEGTGAAYDAARATIAPLVTDRSCPRRIFWRRANCSRRRRSSRPHAQRRGGPRSRASARREREERKSGEPDDRQETDREFAAQAVGKRCTLAARRRGLPGNGDEPRHFAQVAFVRCALLAREERLFDRDQHDVVPDHPRIATVTNTGHGVSKPTPSACMMFPR